MTENSHVTEELQDPKKAIEFIGTVRQQYASNPEVYNSFLDVMKSLKSHKVDIPTMINKVKKLFGNNTYLLQGFNTFLPPTCKIEIDTTEVPSTPPLALTGHDEFGRAKEVVRKIKKRFENHPEIYQNFLAILTSHYASGETHLENTIESLCKLFKNHQDLVEEFRNVLQFHPQRSVDLKKVHREIRPKRKTDEEFIPAHPTEEHVPHLSPKRVKSLEEEGFPVFPTEQPERRKKSRKIDVPDQAHWKEDDLSFFSEVKRNIGSQVLYSHFLRMMKLYLVDDILTKDEFVQLCNKLFAAAPWLNQRLQEYLATYT